MKLRRPAVVLARGLIGAVVLVLGFHLFAGGLIDEFVSASGPPLNQLCTGPQCVIGVASGFLGIFGGVVVAIVGFGLRTAS